MEHPWSAPRSPWNPLKYHGTTFKSLWNNPMTLWNPMERPRSLRKLLGTPLELPEIYWRSMKRSWTPWSTLMAFQNPWNFPWMPINTPETPRNLLKHPWKPHQTPWAAWNAHEHPLKFSNSVKFGTPRQTICNLNMVVWHVWYHISNVLVSLDLQ